MLYLVRHAKAGDRAKWEGDDAQRPLNSKGHIQAEHLATRLAPLAREGALVSSPYVRCVQTLEPLAAALGVTVGTDERLAEDCSFEGVLELLDELADGSVLCSHGDMIPATIAALERRGCRIDAAPDWRKATVWVLARDGSGWVAADCWPPPPDVR